MKESVKNYIPISPKKIGQQKESVKNYIPIKTEYIKAKVEEQPFSFQQKFKQFSDDSDENGIEKEEFQDDAYNAQDSNNNPGNKLSQRNRFVPITPGFSP